MRSESGLNVLKGELIRDTVEGALYRILYISSDTKMGYWIRVDSSSNIPKSINLEDVRMRLNTRIYEAVIDSKDKDDVAKISLARQSERDRIWEQIKDIVTNEPAIYVRKTRGVLLHQQEKKTGVGIDKLYNYLGRFWRGGMTLDSLLPSYDKRGNCSTETVYTSNCSVTPLYPTLGA